MKQQNAVKTFAILTIFLLAVFGTFLMAKPVQASESGQVTVTGERYYSKAWRILELVNQERAKAGLPALVMDRDLLDAAMQRAFEISVNFSHTRPNGEEFQSAFEASRWAMGENIAAGNTSPEAAMEAWMNSDGHRSNILDRDFVCIGVGAVNVNGKYYWVQCFGGTLKETASRNNYQDGRASAHISFDQTLASVRLCVNKNVLYLGGTAKASLCFEDVLGEVPVANDTLLFQSSNPAVCTVDAGGNIRGVGIGTAAINLVSPTDGSVLASANVTVTLDLKETSIKKLTAGKKKVTVRWKKQRKNTDGYEIQYSTNKKFKKAVKTVTVKNNKKNIKTIKKLKRGKKYYVRIRTYKDVFSSGQTIRVYSDWSKKKSVKVR